MNNKNYEFNEFKTGAVINKVHEDLTGGWSKLTFGWIKNAFGNCKNTADLIDVVERYKENILIHVTKLDELINELRESEN